MAQDVYSALIMLARQHYEEGLFNQAEDFYKQAIAAARDLLLDKKDWQQQLLIESISELAKVYDSQGKWRRNEPLWLEIIKLGKKNFQLTEADYTKAIYELAHIKEKKGETNQAEALYKTLLHKQEMEIGDESIEICSAIKQLAAFYCRQGNYAQAENLYLRALALEEFHLGTCSEQINSTVDSLANIFAKQKKWRLAEYMLERQKDILNILHGEGSLCARCCELRLAELLAQSGQISKALKYYKIVLQTYINMFGQRSKPVQALDKKINKISSELIDFAPGAQAGDKKSHETAQVRSALIPV
jgi:tetratricopeptide (TPR) repeat protein